MQICNNILGLLSFATLFAYRRWLRLLFGREFQLLDLLVLWDAIFSEGHHFDLINYIVVAMLISIREESMGIALNGILIDEFFAYLNFGCSFIHLQCCTVTIQQDCRIL